MRRTFVTLLILLWLPAAAWGATESVQVDFLPLDEAARVVQSQLSPTGSVTSLPSRHLLIINDSPTHIRQARELLQTLDQPLQQYRLQVEITESDTSHLLQAGITRLHLPGGWMQAELAARSGRSSYRKTFSLLVSSHQHGSVETGTLQPFLQQTRQWLAGYGIITTQSMELVAVTSGFHAVATPAGENMVRIRITPWARQAGRENMIELAGAATEVTIPLNQTVTIAATSGEAENYGALLLAASESNRKQTLLITLSCKKN